MKVLMFGWEFPPHNSGGLGVACQHLVKALANQGVQTTFVLPKKVDCQSDFCKMVYAKSSLSYLKIKEVNALLSPYMTAATYATTYRNVKRPNNIYSPNLVGEVARYGKEAKQIAMEEDYDIIHAHDWLSFPAGLTAKKVSGKPLVVHVHATEYDRTGGNGLNPDVYKFERRGVRSADAVIAVSDFTRDKIINNYGVNSKRVNTVHNAINFADYQAPKRSNFLIKSQGKKIVLFVGRITIQKGPDYFLQAAKKVLDHMDDVLFVVAGSGDMEGQMIEGAAAMGIADKFLFAGFLRDQNLVQAYQMADLYVLPSVSEPFGLTPLESMVYGTPVLISNQSGVAEVVSHALKVDFWDVNEMANKIISVLQNPELKDSLISNGEKEVKEFNWNVAAQKCVAIYNKVLRSKK